jgi:hypothetical protein
MQVELVTVIIKGNKQTISIFTINFRLFSIQSIFLGFEHHLVHSVFI